MSSVRNIVLTGFMGTGKTTVGLLVADQIRWKFVDADEEIVERVGRSIPEIFEQEGEQGFRRYESIVCQSLAARQQTVISTGGGMLVNPANLAIMTVSGLVICLNASPDTIEQRLGDFDGRPLAPNWKELFSQRRAAYDQIPYQIDTTDRTPEEVARLVIGLWQS